MLGSGTILLLLLMQRWLPRLPAGLIAVALGIAAVSALDLEAEGVAVVGDVPAGLPGLEVPDLGGIRDLSGAAAAVALLVYVETIAVAREFATRHAYEIDPNRELVATGAANLGSGLFQGFPVDASFSQSALGDSSGARTQLAGAVTAIAVAIVLVALTGLLSNLPSCVLAAIIIVAVVRLIKVGELRRLWRLQQRPEHRGLWIAARVDFVSAAVTFAGTLALGILEGILIGVAFTLLALLQRATRPNVAVLGRVPGSTSTATSTARPEPRRCPAS